MSADAGTVEPWRDEAVLQAVRALRARRFATRLRTARLRPSGASPDPHRARRVHAYRFEAELRHRGHTVRAVAVRDSAGCWLLTIRHVPPPAGGGVLNVTVDTVGDWFAHATAAARVSGRVAVEPGHWWPPCPRTCP